MKKILVSVIVFATLLPAMAQEGEKKISIDFYGFVRNDFYYESRQSMTSAAGLFHLIPLDKKPNGLGEDLAAIPSVKLLSTATRFGLRIKGPDVWGATASARLEGDFDGFTSSDARSNTMLRLRQGWIKLAWEKTDLLVGQTWHPMFGEVVPSVLSLATGSPFQPFNRAPQVRVDYKVNKSFKTYLSGLYQMQFLSVGPSGASPDYVKNAMLPEFYAGFDFAKNGWLAGAGASFLHLRPRVIGEIEIKKNVIIDGEEKVNTVKEPTKVSDNISSLSLNAFVQYVNDKFAVKAKSIYGQNMGHLLLMSGYGISKMNSNGSYEYTNLNNSTSWLNVTYGNKYQAGLFLGYSKNLGSSKALVANPYVFGFSNIDQVYRISPQVSYNLKHWQFGIEYEMTGVSYGAIDFNDGKVKNTHDVINNRVAGVMVYNF